MGGGVKEGRKGGGKWRKGARRRWAHAMYSFFILYVTNLWFRIAMLSLCALVVCWCVACWCDGEGEGMGGKKMGWDGSRSHHHRRCERVQVMNEVTSRLTRESFSTNGSDGTADQKN